jgi:hypothetical protein
VENEPHDRRPRTSVTEPNIDKHRYVNNFPTRCDCVQLLFPANWSTYFRWYLHPSSGARVNCNYRIWHWSKHMLISGVVEESELINYSLLALQIKSEDITRNMYSSLQGIKIVLSRMLLNNYWHWFTIHGPMKMKFKLKKSKLKKSNKIPWKVWCHTRSSNPYSSEYSAK